MTFHLKLSIGTKPLRFRFDKIDAFIRLSEFKTELDI